MRVVKVIAATLILALSWATYTMVYARMSWGPLVMAVGPTLFLEPLYWILMILVMSAEIWLALRLIRS
jgi:hypothetical protein